MSAHDVTVYGGPHDGLGLTYRAALHRLARGEFPDYVLQERRTTPESEEFIVLRHVSWFHSEGGAPHA